MNHMVKNVRFHHLKGKTDYTAPSSWLYGKCVDMQGFEGVVFVAYGSSKIGRAATTKTVLRAAGALTTSGPWYNLNGSCATGAWSSAGFNGKMLVTDVCRPLSTMRYLRPTVGGASTDSLLGLFGIQYGMRRPGSTLMYSESATALGSPSTLWGSTRLGQRLSISATATTVTNT